jgi:hypothetical protein
MPKILKAFAIMAALAVSAIAIKYLDHYARGRLLI